MKDQTSNFPDLFKDDNLSAGGVVKAKGQVLMELGKPGRRAPNMNCRIESFGRICQSLDEQRQRWVREMGFGSLLNLVDMHLPRQLAYWLMTRIDLFGKVLRSPDGRLLKLSANQFHWVLGIPNGGKEIPTWKTITKEMKEKVQWIN